MNNDKPINSMELEKDIIPDNINKDILDVINKYAKQGQNISSYSKEVLKNTKGFFLMWVKKDTDLPEDQQVQITTFAQFINAEDIIKSMTKVLEDIATEQNQSVALA